MEARRQTEETIQNLLKEIITYNKSWSNDYYDLGREIQISYDIHDYADLYSNLVNYCRLPDDNEETIKNFSDDDLKKLEQALTYTAKIIGLNIPGLRNETGYEAVEADFPYSIFANPLDTWGQLLYNITDNPFLKLLGLSSSTLSGNRESTQQATTLSYEMMKALSEITKDVIVSGMQVTRDHGPVIAMAAYASGNVALGIGIGVAVTVCDVTLAINEYNKTGDWEKLIVTLTETVVTILIGMKMGNITEKFLGLGKEEMVRILSPSIDLLVGSVITKYFQIIHGYDVTDE